MNFESIKYKACIGSRGAPGVNSTRKEEHLHSEDGGGGSSGDGGGSSVDSGGGSDGGGDGGCVDL